MVQAEAKYVKVYVVGMLDLERTVWYEASEEWSDWVESHGLPQQTSCVRHFHLF